MNNNTDHTDIQSEELAHLWHHCHHCGASPILGLRYHCTSCPVGPKNDLCAPCYEKLQRGEIVHPAPDTLGAAMAISRHSFQEMLGKPMTGVLGWLDVEHPQVPPPTVPDFFVVRPVFNAGDEASIGGYAFLARVPGQERGILLTALHVMDELIKKVGIDCTSANTCYTGHELPRVITSVNFFDVYANPWMVASLGTAAPMMVLPHAGTGEDEPFSHRDIAAFSVKELDISAVNPVPLATSAPLVGEPVWLAARLESGKGRTVKAVVVEKTERSLVFSFQDNQGERPKYSSGAPILNRKGEVVGINVGGGCLQGSRLGHANHVENIRRHLDGV